MTVGSTLTGAELIPIVQSGANVTTTPADLKYYNGVTVEIENIQTIDYTLVIGDMFKTIIMNKATAINLTVPPNSSVAFPVATKIAVRRIGAGQLTFVQGSGVTIITSLGAFTDPGIDVLCLLTKTATNTWYLDNGIPNSAVPTSRTLAGLDLTTNRTASELDIALGLVFSVILRGATYNRLYGSSWVTAGSTSTASLATGSLKASPFIVSRAMTLDAIYAEVTTFGASSKVRLGVYADNGSGYPASLVAGSAEIDAGSNGVKSDATYSASLTPGLYWLACLGGTAACTYRAEGGTSYYPAVLGFDAAMGGTVRQAYWVVAQAYGALPGSFPAGATINNTGTNIPLVLVHAA